MIAKIKILLVAITLFSIAIVNTNILVNEFKCDTEKTVKYTFEECEKESEEKKNQSDEFTNDFFTYSPFTDKLICYSYKQNRNTFELSITLFKPPIAS